MATTIQIIEAVGPIVLKACALVAGFALFAPLVAAFVGPLVG